MKKDKLDNAFKFLLGSYFLDENENLNEKAKSFIEELRESFSETSEILELISEFESANKKLFELKSELINKVSEQNTSNAFLEKIEELERLFFEELKLKENTNLNIDGNNNISVIDSSSGVNITITTD